MVVSPLKVTDNETKTRGEVSPLAKNQPDGQSSERDDSSTFFVANATERDLAFGQGVRCVGKRVDALIVAFKVEVGGGVFDQISTQQALANEVGAAELVLGDFRFALKRSRQSRVPFENADLRGIFDHVASGGFVLELTARALFLATRALREAVALLMRIAAAFGVVRAFRLRRFDLAADYAGFVLSAGDVDRVLTTRARLLSFRADPKDFDEEEVLATREHRDSALTVTGITVAPGNPLMARIYAKDVELMLPGREGKRAIEHQIWLDHGWDGEEPVARVEFQCRGVFLDEIQLRDPLALEANLDAVFQLCVRWMRLIEPGTNPRRIRSRFDPRWEIVMNTVFVHDAAPLARSRRHRGGARPSHVAGALRSALASIGLLRASEFVTRDGEVFEDEVQFAAALDAAEAEVWVRQRYKEMFGAGSDLCASEILTRFGARDAVRAVAAIDKAAIARFSSADPTTDDGDAK